MAAERDLDVRETRAVARYIRTAPPKLRIVADLIRGMPVLEARRILDFSGKAGGRTIRKVVDSAAANAESSDLGLTAEELFVSKITVDEGPTLKRWMPRARGRATRIRKRTSHITVYVREIPEEQ